MRKPTYLRYWRFLKLVELVQRSNLRAAEALFFPYSSDL